MQTFLPYPDFEASAQALDWRRLGKQRVEAWQILLALADPSRGWQHHPAVQMWRGFPSVLEEYYAAVCREWIQRGYRHTMPILVPAASLPRPPWLGDPAFHLSHRSSLYFKDPVYYREWAGIDRVPYVWPHG